MTRDPEFDIRGMAEYHTPLIFGMAKAFVECEPVDRHDHRSLIDVQQERFRFLNQLVEQAIREAYFRGASHGLSLASMTKYMVVTAEQMEAIKARVDEESVA